MILLDLHLPDSQGLETLHRIRAADTSLPIVVLTGHRDRETGVGALQAGAEEHLPKGDLSPELLERAIRYAIERSRLRKALDASRRKELQRTKALQEVARLREIDTFKTELLDHVSHELKTPLTPMKLQLYLLKSAHDKLDERERRALDIVRRNVERLQTIVLDAIDSVRIENHQLTVHPHAMPLRPLLDEVLRNYANVAREKDITVTLHAHEDPTVLADRTRIHQVLSVLVDNAIRYSPRGAHVTLTLDTDNDRAHAQVTVADDGDGLTPQQQTTLFAPFVRFHPHKDAGDRGTGLGLFVAKGIIEAHKGMIWCTSPGPGQGSRFTFTLPVTRTSPHPVGRDGASHPNDAAQDDAPATPSAHTPPEAEPQRHTSAPRPAATASGSVSDAAGDDRRP